MPGIAHPDPHGDHEGRGTEELRKHLPLTCFRSAGLKIQDHMHYDHSEYTQRLQKVQLRLPPGKTTAVELFTRRRFRSENGVLTLESPTATTWFLEVE